jgi:hypothetical protein
VVNADLQWYGYHSSRSGLMGTTAMRILDRLIRVIEKHGGTVRILTRRFRRRPSLRSTGKPSPLWSSFSRRARHLSCSLQNAVLLDQVLEASACCRFISPASDAIRMCRGKIWAKQAIVAQPQVPHS